MFFSVVVPVVDRNMSVIYEWAAPILTVHGTIYRRHMGVNAQSH